MNLVPSSQSGFARPSSSRKRGSPERQDSSSSSSSAAFVSHRSARPSPVPTAHDDFLDHFVQSSLLSLLDEDLVCQLRDGKRIFGRLMSFDQFSNVCLHSAFERQILFEQKIYVDVPLGITIIRGENIVCLAVQGQTGNQKNEKQKEEEKEGTWKKLGYHRVTPEQFQQEEKKKKAKEEENAKERRALGAKGFNTKEAEDDLV